MAKILSHILCIPCLPHMSCLILSKLLNVSETQLHLLGSWHLLYETERYCITDPSSPGVGSFFFPQRILYFVLKAFFFINSPLTPRKTETKDRGVGGREGWSLERRLGGFFQGYTHLHEGKTEHRSAWMFLHWPHRWDTPVWIGEWVSEKWLG